MSTTTTGRRETTGIVPDALRRPVQEAIREGVKEAIREGVKEAMQEQEGWRSEQRGGKSGGGRFGGGRSGSERFGGDEGGSGRSRFALLALLGVSMAALLLWRRKNEGPGGPGGVTQSIREQAKSGRGDSGGAESVQPESEMGGAIEPSKEDMETEDAAPGAGGE